MKVTGVREKLCAGYDRGIPPFKKRRVGHPANLLSQSGWSPTYNACTETTMGAVTANANNQISGLSYDASGNTLTDGNYTYTWNGESEMKTAGGVTYAYDGDGRRAAKVGSKLYWYGSGGDILSETDASGNTLNDYVFFDGKRVAVVPASGSALYYAEDLLGSSRVIVESNGTLCYDGDFTPFGGEREYTSTCSQNYKFEGKERDTETGNDDFGAREYSWRFGRWLSSDWSATPVPVPYANLSNPQTLNLYAMVSDDPESFADLDRHEGDPTQAANASPSAGQCTDPAGCSTPPQPAQTTNASAVPLVLPVAPTLDIGKIVTTAVDAVAGAVTSTTAAVVGVLGYLVSPGTSNVCTCSTDQPQVGTPASTSQQGAVDTSPMAAHSTGERESTRQGHEEGEARAARDRGGEKGDKAGTYPRKPPKGWKTGERGNKSGKWPPTNPRDQRIADN
jgi:RHS repeat-associated protein